MTIKHMVNILRKHRPQNKRQVEKLGLNLKYLSSGSFKDVFKIVGTSAVIKFPSDRSDVFHSRNEIHGFRILSKYKKLKKHIPKIYYHDSKNGVIVMKRYKAKSNRRNLKLEQAIQEIFGYSKNWSIEISGDNLGIDKRGTIKIIDMGLL